MKKRVLSLLLTVSLMLSLLCGFGTSASAAGAYVKTTSLSIGDRVVFTSETVSMELSSISTTSTKYGIGSAFTGEPGGIMVFEVCQGYSSGTYAFKNNGKYLYWTSGNSLNLNATLSAKTSWIVSFDRSGNATILNSNNTARQIWWNISSPRFACYTGKTLSTTGYAPVQIYKATEKACNHENTTYAVTTPPTCEDKGIGTYTCNACGVTWTETIAATGHTHGFTNVNGMIYRLCSACGESEAVTMNTFAEAKAYTSKSAVYNVKGVVTYIKGRTVYIEDDMGALCVYFSTAVDLSKLRLGDEIFVSSTMTTYQGLPELNNVSQYLVLSSGNVLPNTTTVSIGEIMADADFVHLGKRVTLKNITLGVVNTSGYTPLTDAEGNSICIYAVPTLSSDIRSGNKVDVTGIISYYKNGFQLLINGSTAQTDVKKVGEGVPIVKETKPIAFAKAGVQGIYYQVEGVVTCLKGRQIFIQDETGGIVIYLAKMPTEAPCAVGDLIRVYGSFGNYDGVLELQYVDHTDPEFFKILSHDNQVVAQPVTIEQLLADSAIDYELFAEKVFLNDVSILEIDDKGTVCLWQDDYTIDIYTAPTLNEGCVQDAVVDVTATVSGYNFNYELVIVDANAITYGSKCTHKETMPVNGTSPGCTTSGYTGDLYCTVCGAFVAKGQTIPPTHEDTKLENVLEPTCTTAGYSGDLYCTVCGVLVEKGQSVPPTHNVITINDVEASCDGEGYTGDQFCQACGEVFSVGTTISPLGHDYAVDFIKTPTCTEHGEGIYSCRRCDESYVDEVPATGHTCFYVEQGDVHTYTCSICWITGSEEHNFDGGTCSLCGANQPEGIPVDSNISIRHTLNLASDISVNFVVEAASLSNYDLFYLECVRDTYSGNEQVGSESIIIDNPVLTGSYYYFTLTGINATQMGDEISATLYMIKGNDIYCSNEDIYSVSAYAYSQLDKTNASDSLKTLCADLLRYGSAAQIFKTYRTDSLVDGRMTEVHKTYLSDLEAVTFATNATQHGDVASPSVTWEGKALVLDSKIMLRYIFNATNYEGDVNALTLRVKYQDYSGKTVTKTLTNPKAYNPAKNWYAFEFDGLLAAELRTIVTVAVYAGNTQVSETLSYSADTYPNGKTGNLLAVCKAMLAYSDSAKAYFVG